MSWCPTLQPFLPVFCSCPLCIWNAMFIICPSIDPQTALSGQGICFSALPFSCHLLTELRHILCRFNRRKPHTSDFLNPSSFCYSSEQEPLARSPLLWTYLGNALLRERHLKTGIRISSSCSRCRSRQMVLDLLYELLMHCACAVRGGCTASQQSQPFYTYPAWLAEKCWKTL